MYEPFLKNTEDEYILDGCSEIRKHIDYHQVSLIFAYQGIVENNDEDYLWPRMPVSKLLNVHIEFDFLNGRYIAVNQENDIVFIMKKWSSSYKGDSEYPGNAIPLYSGTGLYIKKEYIEILEEQFGKLKMKTCVQPYTQTY